MGSPYTSQAIADYNVSPPTDDGSQVAANQVQWSKHKDKLADPIKNLAESINSAVGSAFEAVYDTTAEETAAGVTPTDFTYLPPDIRRYGAAVDGATDDYDAIVDALDAYDIAFIPAGTTIVGTTITLTANQILQGQGWRQTFLTADSGLTSDLIIVDDRCLIRDMQISGTGTKGTTNGIKTADTGARWNVENITVNNFVNGFNLQACWIVSIRNFIIQACTDGIYVNNDDNYDDPVNAVNLHGGEIASCSQSGIHFEQGAGGTFGVNNFNCFGVTIEPSGTYGVWVENVGVQTMLFSGCYFEACGDAIYRQDTGVNSVTFQSCLLFVDNDAADKGIDITAGTTENLILIGNEIDRGAGSSATEAIDIGASATVNNAVLMANTWDDAALVFVNDGTGVVTAIADERLGTKIPEVESISAGNQVANSNNFMGKVSFGSLDTTKAVSFGTNEDDADYRVDVFGFDWDHGAVWATSQTTSGFTINITTARGSGSREIYWQIYRR